MTCAGLGAMLLYVKGVEGRKAADTITVLLQRKDEHCKKTNMFFGAVIYLQIFTFCGGEGVLGT
jgi:hypothetical protein